MAHCDEKTQKSISFAPQFNYQEFLDDNLLTDCTVVYNNDEGEHRVRAHIAILATSSEFFFNAFTSGMSEQETKIVNITVNPNNMFPQVMRYMYTGEIQLKNNFVMSAYSIANFYGISKLSKLVKWYLDKKMSPRLLLDCLQECYDSDLKAELHFLTPTVAQFIRMQGLSDQIDVGMFSEALTLSKQAPRDKVVAMRNFLGDYVLSEEEKALIEKSIKYDQKTYELMNSTKETKKWLP